MLRNFSNRVRDPRFAVRAIVAALLAANIIAAGLLLFPPGGSADDLERQLVSLQSQVQAHRVMLERTRQHVASVEKARVQGDQFLNDYFLASRSHVSELFTALETAAAQSKITPKEQAIATEPVEGSDSLSMLTITAAYEGTYSNLMRFVHEIDGSPRLLIIESLNAAPQQGAGMLTVSMKMETFVREDGDLVTVARIGPGASQ
jgi:Tfp pilus assembly protein PilO